MKQFALIALIAFAALGLSAFAAEPPQGTPTGDKVQFQIVVESSVCTFDADGSIRECSGIGEKDRIRDNVSGELMKYGCKPACKYNDSTDISKTYKVMRDGREYSVDVTVYFTRGSEIGNDDVADYDVELHAGLTGADPEDERSALVNVSDISGLKDLNVNTKNYIQKNADGSTTRTSISASVVKFAITK